MESLEIRTGQRTEFVEITDRVNAVLRQNNMQEGICVVYCPHTTAAVTVNENADPYVVHDMLAWLNRSIPQHQPDFRHSEGNSDAHIKSSLIGPSVTLVVDKGALVLGRWQGLYFCEFDGPRVRQVHVQILARG
ncbi:MAG TPA: secondary thiamine-phosphate synthase enzyme YjbQ [Gemmataceae bacterium]|jgi:secondary thiamine-phosphate synthase enzyme|nr:secondary thiamine-phosphate synthase enzyme YjbQ [Gemmataceae bacterium]